MAGLLLLAICIVFTPTSSAYAERPQIYTTIFPLYDLVTNIGGERIDSELIIPAGAEPHTWEPSPRLLGRIERADLLIYVGAGMEPWIDRLLQAVSGSRLKTLEASRNLELLRFEFDCDINHMHHNGKENEAEPQEGKNGHNNEHNNYEHDDHEHHNHEHGHGHGEYDPHVWLDPLRKMEMADAVAEALIAVDPEGKEYYEQRHGEHKKRLAGLHEEFATALKDCEQRKFVVNHAAFGYLADRYDLRQIPLQGLTHEEEPTAARLAAITEKIAAENIDYIFYETLTSPRLAEVVARETGADILPLHPIEGLTREEKEAGEDYLSLMRKNLTHLQKALGD